MYDTSSDCGEGRDPNCHTDTPLDPPDISRPSDYYGRTAYLHSCGCGVAGVVVVETRRLGPHFALAYPG